MMKAAKKHEDCMPKEDRGHICCYAEAHQEKQDFACNENAKEWEGLS